MFDKYPYSVKIKALIIFFVLLAITAYKRSYSSLIDVYNENVMLKDKIEKINSKTGALDRLNGDISILDELIGKENSSKETVQQEIISFVTQNCKRVSINTLQSIHEYRDADFLIFTNQLDVTGTYHDLSELVYLLETKFKIAKVISVDYLIEKKNNTTKILHLKIIFQNYENNK
jgi:hypothetical protein